MELKQKETLRKIAPIFKEGAEPKTLEELQDFLDDLLHILECGDRVSVIPRDSKPNLRFTYIKEFFEHYFGEGTSYMYEESEFCLGASKTVEILYDIDEIFLEGSYANEIVEIIDHFSSDSCIRYEDGTPFSDEEIRRFKQLEEICETIYDIICKIQNEFGPASDNMIFTSEMTEIIEIASGTEEHYCFNFSQEHIETLQDLKCQLLQNEIIKNIAEKSVEQLFTKDEQDTVRQTLIALGLVSK